MLRDHHMHVHMVLYPYRLPVVRYRYRSSSPIVHASDATTPLSRLPEPGILVLVPDTVFGNSSVGYRYCGVKLRAKLAMQGKYRQSGMHRPKLLAGVRSTPDTVASRHHGHLARFPACAYQCCLTSSSASGSPSRSQPLHRNLRCPSPRLVLHPGVTLVSALLGLGSLLVFCLQLHYYC